MKINRINLSESITDQYDLKPINMNRMGDVVLIAGKNGSGKSRFIELIKQRVNDYPTPDRAINVKNEIAINEKNIESHRIAIQHYENALLTETIPNNIAHYNSIITRNTEIISNAYEVNREYHEEIRRIKEFEFAPEKSNNSILEFVPKSLLLKDSSRITPLDQASFIKKAFELGVNDIADGTISLIESVVRKWVTVNTKDSEGLNVSSGQQEKIIEDYERLKKYIRIFLNTNLERDTEGRPLLFKKRIGDARLSHGQIILLQFCIALFGQESRLEDMIILMDEPENHLHPSALIEIIDKIKEYVKGGQLFIATHSVHVLAHFDPSCIWYMDKGEISYAGNIPQKVLSGLLGDESEIEKLSNFLSLPTQMASTKFAFESLFYPQVVITGADDPQVAQISEIITQRSAEGNKLEVLDFGVGKARLLSTIYENDSIKGGDIKDWLSFYGYDIDKSNKDICNSVFEKVYGSSHERYFNDENSVLLKLEKESLDFIIMCNVFHEIDPAKWIGLFTSPRSIFNLLKNEGHLLIVEDQSLAIGEKAHSKGFLLFDSLEFKTLFKMNTSEYKSNDYRGDGRLKAHFIPKNCLQRIDIKSITDALRILLDNSKNEIQKLRALPHPVTLRDGKNHGFWAQQLANSHLALGDIQPTK